MSELRQLRTRVNDVELHVIEGGAGEPVVLLHGFPDFWYGWRHQIGALLAAGHRVIVPDLRGYNESERPRRVNAYRPDVLCADVAALIRDRAGGSAVLAGHDWGGVIAWRVAAEQPQLVRRLVILNAPHPALYLRRLADPRQLLRSWYVGFNQLPWLPEIALRAFDYALLRRGYARLMPAADVEKYIAALSRPGALTAALHYYRAAARALLRRRRPPRRVTMPTLVLWGERDRALDVRLLEGLEQYVTDLTIVRFAAAAHFVHWEAADAVNAELLAFLRRP